MKNTLVLVENNKSSEEELISLRGIGKSQFSVFTKKLREVRETLQYLIQLVLRLFSKLPS